MRKLSLRKSAGEVNFGLGRFHSTSTPPCARWCTRRSVSTLASPGSSESVRLGGGREIEAQLGYERRGLGQLPVEVAQSEAPPRTVESGRARRAVAGHEEGPAGERLDAHFQEGTRAERRHPQDRPGGRGHLFSGQVVGQF